MDMVVGVLVALCSVVPVLGMERFSFCSHLESSSMSDGILHFQSSLSGRKELLHCSCLFSPYSLDPKARLKFSVIGRSRNESFKLSMKSSQGTTAVTGERFVYNHGLSDGPLQVALETSLQDSVRFFIRFSANDSNGIPRAGLVSVSCTGNEYVEPLSPSSPSSPVKSPFLFPTYSTEGLDSRLRLSTSVSSSIPSRLAAASGNKFLERDAVKTPFSTLHIGLGVGAGIMLCLGIIILVLCLRQKGEALCGLVRIPKVPSHSPSTSVESFTESCKFSSTENTGSIFRYNCRSGTCDYV